jgi:pyruvate formate lyase activating enzyme
VTGGEPTLEPELAPFLEKIKALGYLIKLDTNGYRPEVLADLVHAGLVDYVAMDLKSSLSGYERAAGKPGMHLENIEKSVRFLLSGSLPFEFRTTVVEQLHSEKEMREIGQWIKGAPAYFLQVYQDSEHVLEDWCSPPSAEKLESFLSILKETVPNTQIRGLD